MTPTPEQNAKRETPRTDAAKVDAGWIIATHSTGEFVPDELSANLETESFELRRRLEEAEKEIQNYIHTTAVLSDQIANYRTLETELIHKQTIIENHCKDWAEDDTAIKELCKRCGVADVHPVGDDFKSCVECVEELAHKFTELRQAADGMWDALDCIANQPDKTATGMRTCAKAALARYRALVGEGLPAPKTET